MSRPLDCEEFEELVLGSGVSEDVFEKRLDSLLLDFFLSPSMVRMSPEGCANMSML